MKLREYLKIHGIKVKWMRDKLKISPKTMSNIMKGHISPRLELAVRIEDITKGAVKPKDLLANVTQQYKEEECEENDEHS